MWQLIPKDDPAQAVRIRRFSMAAASYAMWVMLVLYCYIEGLFNVSARAIYLCFILVALVNAVFYAIFRTGFNKRFKEASLTMPQMITASLFCIWVIYYADSTRGVMLLVYLVVFTFGVFRLRIRQFLFLTLLVLGIYGGVILALAKFHPEKFNPQLELLTWVVLAAVLFWFSMVGGYINLLRANVVKINGDLSKAMATIEQLAIHDELTQVYNRRYIFNVMQREKSLADRGNPSFSICMIDLDHFKRVNDSFGHMMGDMVLKTIAQTIQNNIRQADYLARYGGEEFIVILAYPDIGDALVCAERIRYVCSALSYPNLPESFHITISTGVAHYQPVESVDELIQRADTALYRAKANGRNSVEYQPPLAS